ncbi:MAG: glycosyltransferase [Burkholderiales bacterium]|nr:glycosyltransferase [Burkholderiales bacterium]
MAASLKYWLQYEVPVSVMPFISAAHSATIPNTDTTGQKYDFVYVASGEAHKNHRNLLEAWRLLADEGLKPSLALTIDPESYPFLANEISRHKQEYGLNIVNLGHVPAADIPAFYQSSSALIFPSQVESFGLPLIEATQLGLPVLAPELDYVRDVIQPAETFDPNSPVSIARAVRRFLDNAEPIIQLHSAEEFLAELFK